MKNKQKIIKWGLPFIVVVILLIGFFWPVNSYIETPGGASDLKPFVSIANHPDKAKGKYMITYVQLAQATPFKLLASHFDPHASIDKAQDVTGGVSSETYNQVQRFYMQNAISEAVAVAFRAADKPVTSKYIGIFITDINPKSHFSKALKVGDTVTKIDGYHFDNAKGYQAYLATKKPNDTVTVTYIRNKVTKTVTQKLMDIGGRAGLGIILADNVKVSTTPTVKVDPGSIGGPSGGLMFSLQIYDQLTGKNIRAGRNIAGTGTIALDGSVGEIGGIDKKIIAAKNAGATIFFAPYIAPTKINKLIDGGATNYQVAVATAKKYAPNLKVVPVATFKDAVKYLEETK
ncbi:SepM family pheromone-processing serine protease [Periweissella fabalis]|uniref:PDZ domain-containing protein n=1 Tax=Periweissella fabalis TaxID=1070421 RepID=A0A7X6N5Z6_9LACO|nr:SepM family pheromone-processing serine protease [Periweissella fabalis]MCM0598791.1 PDZ domain-containing protein [Periweissella fabalis]NKZ24610.1 PDZ domain-containing protein [Periweissella fabalis]